MAIIKDLRDFVKEAKKLGAAFSTVGEDDNGYDATGLGWEAETMIAEVKSKATPEAAAEAWLADARKRLDDIA